MSNGNNLTGRRELVGGLAALGAVALAGAASAQPKPKHKHDAPPAPALSAEHKAVIAATADCLAKGRICLARCTDHLETGMPLMAKCQRAVMNMLSVVGAMSDVAGMANADPKLIKQMAKTCAEFCKACADACKPHADHHEECKACEEACLACAKACSAL